MYNFATVLNVETVFGRRLFVGLQFVYQFSTTTKPTINKQSKFVRLLTRKTNSTPFPAIVAQLSAEAHTNFKHYEKVLVIYGRRTRDFGCRLYQL